MTSNVSIYSLDFEVATDISTEFEVLLGMLQIPVVLMLVSEETIVVTELVVNLRVSHSYSYI